MAVTAGVAAAAADGGATAAAAEAAADDTDDDGGGGTGSPAWSSDGTDACGVGWYARYSCQHSLSIARIAGGAASLAEAEVDAGR